jgi:hypothetical protein
MRMHGVCCAALFVVVTVQSISQISTYPYRESFESMLAGDVPTGWKSTKVKNPTGDFKVDSAVSSAHVGVKFLTSTDAKVPQAIISPVFDLRGKHSGQLEFYERRSSTYTAGMIVEASVAEDTNFSVQLTDTLKLVSASTYVKRSIAFPPSLSDLPDVRIRWRSLGNGAGSTGVLRLDDVSLTVAKSTDIALTSVFLDPAMLRAGTECAALVVLKNLGETGRYDCRTTITDSSFNRTRTIIDTVCIVECATNDSISLKCPVSSMKSGRHFISARISVLNDEDTTNNHASASFLMLPPLRSILINEIMYAPNTGPEWVECINVFADTIDLAEWKIGDLSPTRSLLTTQPFTVAPGQYFLIAKDTSVREFYSPFSAPILRATLPSLSNTKDAVVLTDPAGVAMDSVLYESTWGGTNGRSLERRDTAVSATQPSNWGSCVYASGASPGCANSLSTKEFDGIITRVDVHPSLPTIATPVTLYCTIKNNGLRQLDDARVNLYRDADADGIADNDELEQERAIGSMVRSDSLLVEFSLGQLSQEDYRAIVTMTAQRDDDTSNNRRTVTIVVGQLHNAIVINEIMYAPADDAPEWVECYNRSDSVINISGWKISDATVGQKGGLLGSDTRIPPHAYFIIAADSSFSAKYNFAGQFFWSSWGALNNTTPDAVVLFDNRGAAIDSVWYRPSWGGSNGPSLQRIDYDGKSNDSANWGSDVASPGAENALAKKDIDLGIERIRSLSAGTGVSLTAVIKNAGRQTISHCTILWYGDTNRDSILAPEELVHTEEIVTPCLSGDSLLSNWKIDTALAGVQRYFACVSYAEDQRTSNNTASIEISTGFLRRALIVNEIMYEPAPGMCEYVELYNRSADTVSVDGWSIADAPTLSGSRSVIRFPAHMASIPPGGYLVITKDSSLSTQFAGLAGANIYICNRDLSLGNEGDDVVLYDQTGAAIDSVHYLPVWHIASVVPDGKSLERINPDVAENNEHTWSTCVLREGGTPGKRNSIFTTVHPSSARMELSPNPFSPDGDGHEDMLGIGYTLPAGTALIRVRCFDVAGRLVRTIADRELAPSQGAIFWNGLDDYQQRVRVGMYIILFEALDSRGNAVCTIKDVAVVAGRL